MQNIIKDFFETNNFLINKNQKTKFIIALSGGGDSLALAKACADFQREYKNIEFICAIIDHGIAHNSNEVAQIALKRANEIGLKALIIQNHQKILPPIQENARNIRYNLLTQFAFEQNAKAILLGHNFDDQIETILFRLLRKTGLNGLGGMNEINLIINFAKPILILRPLLSQTRAQLRQYLINKQIEYFDDPANENEKFTRVHLRNKIKKLNQNQIWQKIDKIGKNARKLREYINLWVFDFINKNSEFVNDSLSIKIDKFQNLNSFFQISLFEIILKIFANENYLPSKNKIENLILKINENDFKSATLGNLWVKIKKDSLIFTFAPKRKNQKTGFDIPLTAINLRILAACNRFEGFLKL